MCWGWVYASYDVVSHWLVYAQWKSAETKNVCRFIVTVSLYFVIVPCTYVCIALTMGCIFLAWSLKTTEHDVHKIEHLTARQYSFFTSYLNSASPLSFINICISSISSLANMSCSLCIESFHLSFLPSRYWSKSFLYPSWHATVTISKWSCNIRSASWTLVSLSTPHGFLSIKLYRK